MEGTLNDHIWESFDSLWQTVGRLNARIAQLEARVGEFEESQEFKAAAEPWEGPLSASKRVADGPAAPRKIA